MPILLFCPSVAGHRIEYVNHIYMGAYQSHSSLIIVVPSQFKSLKDSYVWPECDSIKFVVFDYFFSGKRIVQAWNKTIKLKEYCGQFKPERVILLDIIEFYPFLPLLLSNHYKVDGIIYRIFTYDWKSESIFRRFIDWANHFHFAFFKVYNHVYLLNDEQSCFDFNRMYHTSKFTYLPDPIAVISFIRNIDVHSEYGISANRRIFLHPGGMLRYKGTLEILKALSIMSQEELNQVAVIFAGRVTEQIREEFFSLYNSLKERTSLVLIEDFLPYDLLGALFDTCDYVLIPYKIKSRSSGILGHAASFNKPVIGTYDSLVGKIIEEYKLGKTILSSTPDEIKGAMLSPFREIRGDSYVKNHSIAMFNKVLLSE